LKEKNPMNVKNFLILAGVTALAVLLAQFAAKPKPAAPEGAGQPVFPELMNTLNDISAVEITTAQEKFSLARGEKGWSIPEKDNYPVELDKVRKLLIGMADLRAVEAKTSNPELYAKLGVDDIAKPNPQGVQVNLKQANGSSAADVVLGSQRPSKADASRTEVYLRKTGEAQAWLAEGNIPLGRAAMGWTERSIANIGGERVRQAEIRQPGGEAVAIFKDKADDAAFQLRGLAEGEKPNATLLDSIAGTLAGLNMEDVAQAGKVEFPADKTIEAVFDLFDGIQIKLSQTEKDGKQYMKLAAAYIEPAKTEEKPAETPAPEAKAEDKPAAEQKPAEPTPEELAAKAGKEVAELNARWQPWVFAVSPFKTANLGKKRDELLEQPPQPEQAKAADAIAAPSTVSPAELIQNLGK
jgi:hypothetical protein